MTITSTHLKPTDANLGVPVFAKDDYPTVYEWEGFRAIFENR
jgi:hypothetical protein